MDWLREILSEGQYLSSKRVAGMILIIFSVFLITGLVIKDGANQYTESLIPTAMIVGAALLGVSSVTGIWKAKK